MPDFDPPGYRAGGFDPVGVWPTTGHLVFVCVGPHGVGGCGALVLDRDRHRAWHAENDAPWKRPLQVRVIKGEALPLPCAPPPLPSPARLRSGSSRGR